jgi:hypothetical protein
VRILRRFGIWSGVVTVIVGGGVVEAEPAKQQVSEQVGARCCSVLGSSAPRLRAATASMPSMAAASAADTSPVT